MLALMLLDYRVVVVSIAGTRVGVDVRFDWSWVP